MIDLEEGLCINGRCTWGLAVGFITEVKQRTYRIKWLGAEETEQLCPDVDDEDEILQAAE